MKIEAMNEDPWEKREAARQHHKARFAEKFAEKGKALDEAAWEAGYVVGRKPYSPTGAADGDEPMTETGRANAEKVQAWRESGNPAEPLSLPESGAIGQECCKVSGEAKTSAESGVLAYRLKTEDVDEIRKAREALMSFPFGDRERSKRASESAVQLGYLLTRFAIAEGQA